MKRKIRRRKIGTTKEHDALESELRESQKICQKIKARIQD